MKGYRTLIVNGAIVAGVALLHYAAGVDWTQFVAPDTAAYIVGGLNLVLRFVTTTPVGQAGTN